MKPKQLVYEAINHKETKFLPYTIEFETETIDKYKEYYEIWEKKILNHILSVAPIDTEKRKKINDKYVIDIYGSIWRIDLKPMHLEKPALTKPNFDDYKFPEISQFIDNEKVEEVKMFIEQNKDRFIVARIGFGLFERTWTICGFENALVWSITEPDFYEELLNKIYKLQYNFLDICLTLPIDGIMFSDDWGDQKGVILGPERWRKYIKEKVAKLYEKVKKSKKVVLSHCCGSVFDIMDDIIEIGLDVLQTVQPEAKNMNPYILKKIYGDKITFWGGLGSQSIIPFGTPYELKKEIEKLCKEMGKGGGYILGCSKPIRPETPIENIITIIETFTTQKF